jgi:hypothetical protein
VQSIGVCYGMLGNNLPSPRQVVHLYRSKGINGMRIYGPPNKAALDALRDSGIGLILDTGNDVIDQFASNPSTAVSWVQTNVHVGSDHRFLLGSIISSFTDQPSALSPVTESMIERTNTRLVGPVGTQKPHRNTQFTRTSTRRKMNSVLDGDERRGAYAPIYILALFHRTCQHTKEECSGYL